MKKYFLSVCTIIRDESEYLPEFLSFHLLQGVEHFYLLDNHSIDNTIDVLRPYIDRGLVTLYPYPGERQQVKAYQWVLDTYGYESEWISFQDCDEFLFYTQLEDNPLLRALARSTSDTDVAGIAVAWNMFGSSGHIERPPGLVIESYVHTTHIPDKHVKSVVRPRRIASAGRDPHVFYPLRGYVIVDEAGVPQPKDYAVDTSRSRTNRYFCMHHYHTKSYSEYLKRRTRPDVGSGFLPSKAHIEHMFRGHNFNEREDTWLRDTWADKVKEKMGEFK